MTQQLRFVVQEHHARRLHWDFRLERDGVLVSWAIPKGLPPDPASNHLAVHVEDHPLEYGTFSGTIPAGQYGAGTVRIWDQGHYETEKWTEREVKVVLHGKRTHGRFVLFRTKDPNWMIHRMDGPEHPAWQAIPHDLAPMTAAPGKLAATTQQEWAYEMKWAGVRVLIAVEGGRLRIDADHHDVTRLFPELNAIGLTLGTTQVLLDGILVAFDESGRPDAGRIRQRLEASNASAIRRLATRIPTTLLAFDLLHRDGRALLSSSYVDRRQELDGLGLALDVAQVPPSFDGDGRDALDASRIHGLSGIVAKRLESVYQPGLTGHDWLAIDNA
jgi:bifunctional non-homologous end joining protein LigD